MQMHGTGQDDFVERLLQDDDVQRAIEKSVWEALTKEMIRDGYLDPRSMTEVEMRTAMEQYLSEHK
jgi:hypothetical protein